MNIFTTYSANGVIVSVFKWRQMSFYIVILINRALMKVLRIKFEYVVRGTLVNIIQPSLSHNARLNFKLLLIR